MFPKRIKSRRTIATLAAYLFPLAVAAAVTFLLRIDPAEDAHIMFRYAENLAEGQGLVWNVGENPVEGATEFLWTILLSGGILLGFEAGPVSQVLAYICIAGTITVMIRTLQRHGGTPLPLASGAAALFASGPVLVQGLSGFGAPLFTLLIAVSWSALYALSRKDAGLRGIYFRTLSLSLLLLCLTRPEGVLFAGMIFISAFCLLHRQEKPALILTFTLYFLLPGILYFLWRWNYFGWFLPNTFYAKQGGELIHWNGFLPILRFFWILMPVLIPPAVLVLISGRRTTRRALLLSGPPILFPWAYLLIEQMQNIGQRFQFPVLPVILMLAALAASRLREREGRLAWRTLLLPGALAYCAILSVFILPRFAGEMFSPGAGGVIALVCAMLLPLLPHDNFLPLLADRSRHGAAALILLLLFLGQGMELATLTLHKTGSTFDHRVRIGRALRPFTNKGYRMVTTEAGWLPFFSGWKAVDPFGLYDEHIAHEGLDSAYLSRLAPDLIMFRVYRDNWASDWVPDDPRWNAMTQLLYRYARGNGYLLAARVGVHHDCCWYFVKRDNPDAGNIRSIISTGEGIPYTTPFSETEPPPG